MPDSASIPTHSSSTAVATTSSQFSPASTVISAPAQALPPVCAPSSGDADDGPVETRVGDDEVASTAEHEHRLARLIGGSDCGVQVFARRRLDPARRRSTETQRRPVGEPFGRLGHWRTTARQTPSTF